MVFASSHDDQTCFINIIEFQARTPFQAHNVTSQNLAQEPGNGGQMELMFTNFACYLYLFSFVDCTSFAVIERLRMTHSFAFDGHFDEYGRITGASLRWRDPPGYRQSNPCSYAPHILLKAPRNYVS